MIGYEDDDERWRRIQQKFEQMSRGPLTATSLSWGTIGATMALTPFVQAFVQSFGTRAATALGPWTRARIRRFVRRQRDASIEEERAARARRHGAHTVGRATRPGIMLRVGPGRGFVVLMESTPAKAVALLPDIDFDGLHEFRTELFTALWDGQNWVATAGSRAVFWSPEERAWKTYARVPGAGPPTADD